MPGYAPTSAPPSTLANAQNLPQPRDVAIPDFTSNVYVPFNVLMSGPDINVANAATVWAPRETRFVLRGGYVFIDCEADCTGAAAVGFLRFLDVGSTTGTVLTICSYRPNATKTGEVNDIVPWKFDLGKGYKSQEKNAILKIGGNSAIGTGVFRASGLVWGVQEL